jgi:Anti-sigma-28 factor, FlgM
MTVDPELRLRIARGDYDVDPQAVAQAIIDRIAEPSGVFVPAQLDRLLVLADQDEPPSGLGAA